MSKILLGRYYMETERTDIIAGKNPVYEAISAGMAIDKVFVAHRGHDPRIFAICAEAKKLGIPVVECDMRKLDQMSGQETHQGVVATVAGYAYAEVSDMLKLAEDRNEKPFLIICDGIVDVHNLGAIIRSANAAGAHGVIIPKRRSASLNSVVMKSAAGALAYVPVARVANLTATISELKKLGIWIYSTQIEDARNFYESTFTDPCAIVIGSEESGISRLVGENCDFKIKIPMAGEISSLNASVAAGIIMFEVLRQRRSV